MHTSKRQEGRVRGDRKQERSPEATALRESDKGAAPRLNDDSTSSSGVRLQPLEDEAVEPEHEKKGFIERLFDVLTGMGPT